MNNLINLNDSFITLKIKESGNHKLFGSELYNNFINNIPDEIYINNITITIITNINYLAEENSIIKLLWYNQINSSAYLFQGCSSISEIDLSNFDTSQITDMSSMFADCISLTSINLNNIKVSQVLNMDSLFSNCISLISLNLSEFYTYNIKNMDKMFYNCNSLISLDLSSFQTPFLTSINQMFRSCTNLKSINLSSFDTQNVTSMNNVFRTCAKLTSLEVNHFSTKSLTNIGRMFSECYSLTSLNLSNFDLSKCNDLGGVFQSSYNLEYLNLENPRCQRKGGGFLYGTKKNIVVCTYDQNVINAIEGCGIVDCSSNWREKQKRINLEDNNCVDNCSLINYKFEFESKCYDKCPDGTFNNNFICEKCHSDCKTCEKKYELNNTNCNSCKSQKKFLYQGNCLNNCPFYHYFDKDDNNFYCTNTNKCPEKYSKLIPGKNECVSDCFIYNDIYKYEFRKNCYINCPSNSISPENLTYFFPEEILMNINKEKKFYCEAICSEEFPLEKIDTQECINHCSAEEMKKNLCIIKYMHNKIDINNKNNYNYSTTEDIILKNIENYFTSDEYNTSNIEKGEDAFININKNAILTLTTTDNQKDNKNSNLTIIDLEECENLLRKYYKIDKDKKIFIKKIDVFQEGMEIPKIEFDVYSKLSENNLTKLNLSICQNTKSSIYIPIILKENIDILNSSSGYYNDICYTYTSNKGTDITLNDRRKEFIKNNKTICQENCVFAEYDYDNKNAKCSCEIKETKKFWNGMYINKEELLKNFINIKNYSNLNILICYRKIFSKNGILYNIEFYLILFFILCHIIFIIYFYKKQLNTIDQNIDNIILNISELNSTKIENKIKKKIKIKIKIQIKGNKNARNKLMNNFLTNNSNKFLKSIIVKSRNDSNKQKESNKIDNLNDYELNELSYESALKKDKRFYSEYTISLFKLKHPLIFTFCLNDYNSKIIKVELFLISFSIYFAINALFFNDETMHKIYEDEGKFELLYQLPQILYSSIISIILNTLLKFLALTEEDILNLKKNKNKEIKEISCKLKEKIKIKIFIFFIVGTILLIFFWYYLSIFGVIYKNTQIHLIKDTIISFAFSLIYPIGLYLLPGIFRIQALSDKKNKNKYLFIFSKILQMI